LLMSPRRTSPPSFACSSSPKITLNHAASYRDLKQGRIINTIFPKFIKFELIFLGNHKIKSTVVKFANILSIKNLHTMGNNHSKLLRSDGEIYW
jgi:hypothetical protein